MVDLDFLRATASVEIGSTLVVQRNDRGGMSCLFKVRPFLQIPACNDASPHRYASKSLAKRCWRVALRAGKVEPFPASTYIQYSTFYIHLLSHSSSCLTKSSPAFSGSAIISKTAFSILIDCEPFKRMTSFFFIYS